MGQLDKKKAAQGRFSLAGLPAAVLADVVLTSMANLPRREDILSVEPQDLDQRSGNALLAGLIQVGIPCLRAWQLQSKQCMHSKNSHLTGCRLSKSLTSSQGEQHAFCENFPTFCHCSGNLKLIKCRLLSYQREAPQLKAPSSSQHPRQLFLRACILIGSLFRLSAKHHNPNRLDPLWIPGFIECPALKSLQPASKTQGVQLAPAPPAKARLLLSRQALGSHDCGSASNTPNALELSWTWEPLSILAFVYQILISRR